MNKEEKNGISVGRIENCNIYYVSGNINSNNTNNGYSQQIGSEPAASGALEPAIVLERMAGTIAALQKQLAALSSTVEAIASKLNND